MNDHPPPPPPPPHGANPKTTKTGLPDGNYDIFIIPPHSAGSGFLYLPSLQVQRNSFLAGVACTLFTIGIWTAVVPVLKQWIITIAASGGAGIALFVVGVAVAAWAIGKTQAENAHGQGPGHRPHGPSDQGSQGYNSYKPHPPGSSRPAPGPQPQWTPPSSPPPSQSAREGEPDPYHQSNSHWSPPPPPPPPPQEPKPQSPKPDAAAWEKAREDTRKREEAKKRLEELRKLREEAQRKKEEVERQARAAAEKIRWEQQRQREKETREREARERLAKEKAEKDKELREKDKQEQANRDRLAKQKLDLERAAREKIAAEAAAKNKTPAASDSARPSYVRPTAQSYASTETGQDRPRGRPSTLASSASSYTESSYAPTVSTARTSPPPSYRGPYKTTDPDKVVIKGVYMYNNMFPKPISQLVCHENGVSDGLILRLTTEGLFIDDDVRGVPQREWDVKAWGIKLVESGEMKPYQIVRATVRDTEGKKYVFVLPSDQGVKVDVGLARLRKGSQVRSMGMNGLKAPEMKKLLGELGYVV